MSNNEKKIFQNHNINIFLEIRYHFWEKIFISFFSENKLESYFLFNKNMNYYIKKIYFIKKMNIRDEKSW